MVTFAKSIFITCSLTCCWQSHTSTAFAQIVPDNTLGAESSVVRTNSVRGAIADYIEGGAARDSNLFHSFTQFDIPTGGKAYFASPPGIDNILTRVTGTDISHIQGVLGVDGGANLFLLNPHGIFFGRQAQLDIAGSFLATTAERYIFESGLDFSAVDPEMPPLLAVNIPLGLQFGGAPGTIVNNSRLPGSQKNSFSDKAEAIAVEGLRAGKGQTISLLGGEIASEGGYLNTVEGRIELGAVGANSRIKLKPDDRGWTTNYDGVTEFGNIKISDRGGIDGGNTGNTQIALTGKNISLGYDWTELDEKQSDLFAVQTPSVFDELPSDRTQITAHNQNHKIASTIDIKASDTISIIDPGKNEQNIVAHTSGTGNAGTINLIADRIITFGASFESWTLTVATGDSGVVNLVANNIVIQNGGGGVNTLGKGEGGTISIDVAEDIAIASGGFGAEARGEGAGGEVEIAANNLKIVSGGIGTGTFASGKGGTIDLNIANNLIIESGGLGADAKGSGDGGRIEIEAKNIQFLSAGLGVNTWSSGLGGEITIDADTILFKDGVIGAESGQNTDLRDFVAEDAVEKSGTGNAADGGNIYISARSLFIDNANVTTSTFGTGNAGNLFLQVDSISAVGDNGDLVTGINSFTSGEGAGGNIEITGDRLKLSGGATIAANSSSSGQAGDITIHSSDVLELDSNGTVSVDGGELGLPGNIKIEVEDLLLSEGTISATTNRGTQQANVRLTGEQLLLSNSSRIITDAGDSARGGNIFIDLKYNLLGKDNSEITASAEQGQGGNIQINTREIFLSSDSSINANSKSGTDGTAQISTLTGDRLGSDLIQLPAKPVDPNQYLTRGCGSNSDNKFISIGRGGLPQNPFLGITSNFVLADLDSFVVEDNESASSSISNPKPIVEAQNWMLNANGNVELIALDDSAWKQKQLNCLK